MKEKFRKLGIGFTTLIAASAFTVISPFYPAIAKRQGIPEWLIGFVFSTFPIASLIVSSILPKIMQSIGRTRVLLIGLSSVATSNILISFIESFDITGSIVSSFVSRMLSGLGAACCSISSIAILTSDYPDEVSKLTPMVEIFVGTGITIGPSFGSLLFSYGGFAASCRFMGYGIIAWIPVLYLLVGPSKPYIISKKETINFREIAFRYVFII
jgi:MFS transporter, DHA1 family, multidrug resistance protein